MSETIDCSPATVSEHRTATVAAGPAPVALLPRGAVIGRYIVLDVLGSGGMGVVYAAYDPELDRRIALKLVRSARKRLLGEAQAAARLSHPNVVAVHDAGTWSGQVFLAMDLVEGQTLRQWLGERRRSWQEIVRIFLLAGRGLAAAHAAGLVHGDFKPENVLLGGDGQVRVADFGLARLATADPPGEGGRSEGSSEGGGFEGTPAYMAPEQRRGSPPDARSDQHSFCLALGRALTGERAPSWVRQAVQRGLSADPEARHASMEAVLAALSRDPVRTRRRLLATAAAAAAVLAAASGLWTVRERERMLCGGGEERAAEVWGGARRTAVRAAFLRTGLPFADDTWRRVDAALAGYTSRWAVQHREACAATRIRGEQSEGLLDRRMLCLGQRLGEARALADLFGRADAQVVRRAVQATGSLGDLAECGNHALLMERVPPPGNAGLRAKVAAARDRLAAARALQAAGKYPEGLAAAREARREAERLPYRPVQAEALFLVGDLQENAGDFPGSESTVREALWAAEESRDDLLRARCMKKLAYTVGYRQGRAAEALLLIRDTRAVLRRAGGDPRLEANLLDTEGNILFFNGRLREALDRFRQSLAASERNGRRGLRNTEVYKTLNNIGAVNDQLGSSAAAVSDYRRALLSAQEVLGAAHPTVATLHGNLGGALMNLGRRVEAEVHLKKALADREALLGPDHPDLAESLNALGVLWIQTGHAGRALPLLRRAWALYTNTLPPDHLLLGMVRNNLGEALGKLGRFTEAREHFASALAIAEKARGAGGFEVAIVLLSLGQVHLDRGAPVAAVPLLERAAAIAARQPLPREQADIGFCLARALWESGRDRGRALLLARRARAGFAAAGEARHAELAEVDAWLVRRGRPAPEPDGSR